MDSGQTFRVHPAATVMVTAAEVEVRTPSVDVFR